jgi:aryl-alcohol dehydrogenase-like predicted oxidoreductase
MRYRMLGSTGLEVSVVGFGAWAIGGGGWIEGWGPQDDADSIATIHRALDAGINWIDTAGAYGLGHSEEVIARALRGVRERPLVFTKCTSTWDEQGNIASVLKAASVRREVEASLRRLEVDALDVCQLHMPVPDQDIEEGWTCLADLQREGKIRFIGVSNFDVPQMRRAQAIAPITSLQPIYSLLNSEIERDVLPFCSTEQIGVVVYSPLASGLLTGRMTRERVAGLPGDDWRRLWPDFHEPRLSRSLAVVEALRPVAERISATLSQLAIAWTLRDGRVSSATVGLRRVDDVEGAAAAAEIRLSAQDIADIDAARPSDTLFAMDMDGTVTVDGPLAIS